ncbi:S-layer homology domain-containing protein, partial [Paenibacillus phytohabitans]|uniref:S-layer homology domain-containing protein n=1 Tax=Paenibacillus phytohabitans TaxID=2654978 RepID=UPI00300A8F67
MKKATTRYTEIAHGSENSKKDIKPALVKTSMAVMVLSQVTAVLPSAGFGGTGIASAAEKKAFNDVSSSSWMYKYVMKIAALGFAEGDTTGNFNPKAPLTHQEAAIMAVRFLGTEEPSGTSASSSLEVSDWASAWVQTAINEGLIKPEEETASGWGTQNASREWLTKLVIRLLDKENEALALASEPLPFNDENQISAWATGYINAASQLKVVQGFEDKTFRPTADVTRAQAAAIFSLAERYAPAQSGTVARGTVVSLTGSQIGVLTEAGQVVNLKIDSTTLIFGTGGASASDIAAGQPITAIYSNGAASYIEIADITKAEITLPAPKGETGATGAAGLVGATG